MTFIAISPFIAQILHGVALTLILLFCALFFGVILAVMFTLGNISQRKILTYPIKAYLFFIRGTPLLVQFFLIYYGTSQFSFLRESFLWPIFQKPFNCAVLALAINTSAYTTVLFTGAIKSINKGEIEACKALGMSWLLMLRRIVLPTAVHNALPAYSNEVVMVLKATSLASTITLLELMGVTQRIISQTYASIEFLLLAGLIYFIINAFIIFAFRYIENRTSYRYKYEKSISKKNSFRWPNWRRSRST